MRGPAVPLLLLAAACASPDRSPPAPAPPGAPEVRAIRTRDAVVVDGIDNDAAWREAPGTEVILGAGSRPPSCLVRAAVCEGTLFLLLRWEDPAEDRGPGDPDAARVVFPGPGTPSEAPPGPEEGWWDVWEWDAAGTDPLGHARDLWCRASATRFPGPPADFPFDGSRVLRWVAEDAGGSMPPGPGGPGPRDAEAPREPTGSAADVLARGRWSEGRWTVEFARSLSTGSADDLDLAGSGRVAAGIALLPPRDATAPGFLVLLLPPPPDDRQDPLAEPLRPDAAGR